MAKNSTQQEFETILQSIARRSFSPVYFLQGEETWYIDQVVSKLEGTVLSESEKSFNLAVLYGRDVNMTTVLGQARRFPMMSEYQLVIIKEAQSMGDFGNEAGQNALISYLEKPVPSTVLVFCYMGKKLDGRLILSKKLVSQSKVLTADRIPEYTVGKWVEAYLSQKGYRIGPKAEVLLVEYIGNNLERLTNELDKIILNTPQGSVIDENHIEKYVGINKEYNIFELQNAVTSRNFEKTFRILSYFEKNTKNYPPVFVIGILTNMMTKMLSIVSFPDGTEEGLKKGLGLFNPAQIKEAIAVRRNYSQATVKNGVKLLGETDMKIKGVDGGSSDNTELIREFLLKFMQ